jgi:hypothetical protein
VHDGTQERAASLCQKGLKITAEIKELAHEYGPMAIKELLERGYG